MHERHAAVWLDHRSARIFLLGRDTAREVDFTTELPHRQVHNSAGSIDGKRAVNDQSYFLAILEALRAADEWIILGPGSARSEFTNYVRSHAPDLAKRIVGVEASDHPTGPQ